MAPNYFQAATSAEKLRGKYYTPPELVRLILHAVRLAPRDTVLDPSCGDGEFLVGAVHALADQAPPNSAAPLARELAGRFIGLDTDEEAVSRTRARLREAIRSRLGVEIAEDCLRVYPRNALDWPSREALLRDLPPVEGRLLVLGNPPYVEAKRLSTHTRAMLKARYAEAVSGAPDLYLYFLHVCLGWLREDDRLAFVLPNKTLVNANARRLRVRLLERGQLRGIDFATQAGLFPGAAVYPVVLHAGAPTPGGGMVELARVERNGVLERRRLASVQGGYYRATASAAFFPPPEGKCLAETLFRLLGTPEEGRLGDVLEILWSVSFHRQGLRERYVTPERPPSPHARKLLGGGAFSGNGEVVRYGVSWGGWWIDYDPERLRADGNPLPSPLMFERPKLIICQNGRTLRAAYDEAGFVLKDTFLCGLPRESPHPLARRPRALLGLLCSRAVHFFYAHVFHGGHVNGGYLHFLRSFLVDIPLGAWTHPSAEAVATLVRQREEAFSLEDRRRLEEEIERRVEAAFGLTREQREAIRVWAAADPNWTARDRTRPMGRRKDEGGRMKLAPTPDEVGCPRLASLVNEAD
jgi:hypothetical protein